MSDSNTPIMPRWAWPFVGMAALVASVAVLALPCLIIAWIWGAEVAPLGILFWAVVGFGGLLGLEMSEW